MTVGEWMLGGATFAYGYVEATGTDIGNLSDTDFTVGSNSYDIDTAAVGATDGTLTLSLDSELTAPELRNLRLHMCGETYAFADTGYQSAIHSSRWSRAGLD